MTLPTKAALLPVDRDALCRLIEHHCPDCNDTTGIPNGTEVEWLADQVIKFFTPAPNRPALPDDVGAVMERLRGLAYNHTAPGDGIGRNTYGEAATLIETLSADREGVEAALKVAHEALLNYACHGGPDLPCKRAAYQCRAECGKQAGDALLAISAIRERGGR